MKLAFKILSFLFFLMANFFSSLGEMDNATYSLAMSIFLMKAEEKL